MSIPRVRVPVTLAGEQHHIVFSFNAFCDVQGVLGRNPFDPEGDTDISSPEAIRAYLWAGMRHEDRERTLEDVGDMLEATSGGFVTALTAVAQAIEQALPNMDEVAAVGGGADPSGSQ